MQRNEYKSIDYIQKKNARVWGKRNAKLFEQNVALNVRKSAVLSLGLNSRC